MLKRVGIIGAGPCGLSQLVAFARAIEHKAIPSANAYDVVCYEKQSQAGGLWNLDWRTGLDSHGEPLHSSMYRHLWSNNPKEMNEVSDYTFDQHFGRPIGSFPPRAVLRDYVLSRAAKYGVARYIRHDTAVRWVEPNDAGRFRVVSEDLTTNVCSSEHFDNLVVATGHYSTPNVPELPGTGDFTGAILHSQDFRDARQFAGRRVVIVGSRYSAEDIALQCAKFGAESVTISYRRRPMPFDFSAAGIIQVPHIERMEAAEVGFSDGTVCANVDAIILCTGYRHHFPFLDPRIRLPADTRNSLYPAGLYRGVVLEADNAVCYLGMQDQAYSFNMFDLQAFVALQVITGGLKLPDADSQRQDSKRWLERLKAVRNPETFVAFQTDYCRELVRALPAFAPNTIDWERLRGTVMEWLAHKTEDVLHFRDRSYPSVLTGTMGATSRLPWIRTFDDSAQVFVGKDNTTSTVDN